MLVVKVQVSVRRSEIEGNFEAPPSKSVTHRALICSGLAEGRSVLLSPLVCDDTLATIDGLRRLGIMLDIKEDEMIVVGGKLKRPEKEIFCGASGTTLRFMTAVCSLVGEECELTGDKNLMERPMKPLLDALKHLGVECYQKNAMISVKGKPKGGEVDIRNDVSSQFISALLLISPLIEQGVVISSLTEVRSEPYVFLTLNVLKKFGINVKSYENVRFEVLPQKYRQTTFKVEGDWSSASYILVAGAVSGKVTVNGLDPKSLQADRTIIDVMEMMGVKVETDEGSITVRKSSLKPIEYDVSDCPDLFLPLCVLCSQANGGSKITGIDRLKFKESDRVEVMKRCLERMHVRTEIGGGSFKIFGSKTVGATIDPYGDHRIAMASAILGLTAEGQTTITDAECVSKSFPDFWDAMNGLNINMQVIR